MNVLRNLKKDKYTINILLNYSFKFVAILLGLISVRVNLEYLGNSLYGLWVTIASIISWMNSGDFGISNGLRNELAKAYSLKNQNRQFKIIATGISTLSKVSTGLFFVILVMCEVLFRTHIMESAVRIPMYITAFFFCVNLCLGISQSIAYSYQKSWLTSFTTFSMTFLSIVSVWGLCMAKVPANLTLFAVINGLCTMIPNLLLMLILNKQEISFLTKDFFLNYDKTICSSILNTGLLFFGLQICSVILSSTDNVIINYLMDSDMVTRYSIITKVYLTGTNLFSILLIALWSAVTYHMAIWDYEWIKNKIIELLKLWAVFSVGVIVVSVFFNLIVRIWLGNHVYYYEPQIVTLFGAYCSMTAFSAIFVNVLNGLGTIKLQLGLAIFEALINIPLSVFFAQECGFGILGVKLATFVCAAISAIILPIQVAYILKEKMKG